MGDGRSESWDELQPALVYMIDVFDQSALAVYAAVFIAMAFGIANVLLMTVFERTREIGVRRAIGFGRSKLVATVVAEAMVVTAIGLALGWTMVQVGGDPTGGGLPVFHVPAFDVALGMGLALLLGLGTGSLPAIQAMRLRIADALRRG